MISIVKHKLVRAAKQTIHRCKMLQPNDRVLIGVSGGPDSVALFQIMLALKDDLSIEAAMIHINHLLRGAESDRDALFTERLAKQYRTPYYYWCVDIQKYSKTQRLSIEEAARNIRYECLFQTMKSIGFNKIALGHQADDNAELFLMNLFRGSGSKGLSGIPPVRNGIIIRPLIRATRSEILQFLTENKLDYVLDSSNDEMTYFRNRIRHHLIPAIQAEYNPNIVRKLNQVSSILEEEEEWIDQLITATYSSAVLSECENSVSLSASILLNNCTPVMRRLIRKSIQRIKGDLKGISFQQIENAVGLLQARKKNWSVDLPGMIRIQSDADVILIKKESLPLRTSYNSLRVQNFEYSIQQPGKIFIKEINRFVQVTLLCRDRDCLTDMPSSALSEYFNGDVIDFPLIVRNVKPGDRFKPSGMKGSQKVSDFFINSKIPKSKRAEIPLFLCQNQIFWIAGFRSAEFGRITLDTKKILKAEVFLA